LYILKLFKSTSDSVSLVRLTEYIVVYPQALQKHE
jgi:hypothetical protein